MDVCYIKMNKFRSVDFSEPYSSGFLSRRVKEGWGE